jgi:hypothetical protein
MAKWKAWKKQTLKLRDDHSWNAPPGYNIFVLSRGAVRFNIPNTWIVKPDPDSIKVYDREPPDDNCVLGVSYLHLPPVDWSGLPLSQLVQSVLDDDSRQVISKGPVIDVPREDLEVSWAELRFLDPQENREAFSRICLGRGANLQSLITFDFWVDDAAQLAPVWDEVIRSLVLGQYVQDPTKGDVIH